MAACLTDLPGVGPAIASRLGKLGIQRPGDLLFLLPQRYEDRTRLTPMRRLRFGQRAQVEGEIVSSEVLLRRRRSLLVTIMDDSGSLTLRFFHFGGSQQAALSPGRRLRCYGEARPGPAGLEMVHPEYRVLPPSEEVPLALSLTPVYPVVEGLAQGRLRKLVDTVLDAALRAVPDWLPQPQLRKLSLPSLASALETIHRPPPDADIAALLAGVHPAQRRLALEELLAHHLSLRRLRELGRREMAPVLDGDGPLIERFVAGLGFALTGDQQRALSDIVADIGRPTPMLRLLQGDVGCGKTVVAAIAALHAVAAGRQAAVMAPTELLAEQHRENFRRWLEPLGIGVAWLSGALRGRARSSTLAAIGEGEAKVVVGTHALFQEGVEYHDLALVVVDEQHRFGVHQRLKLLEKAGRTGLRAHQLVMTATPIPRTLAMTMYADLDVSVIRELPPGRQPVKTVAIPEERRSEIVERVREACRAGSQAYWVCPLIEDSEHLPSQAAESTAEMLSTALPGIRTGLIHGRMPTDERDRTMKAFAAGDIRLLVATTVIEVGVDVPAASLMIIENAERLGLSQLHQLRGRVGRGASASTCVLIYRAPLSHLARERLDVLRRTGDGFIVAQRDLELRGPGEVLGTRQTGLTQLRVADLLRDADLLPAVQRLAGELLQGPGSQVDDLIERWVGAQARYGEV
ncbi:MAG: ATP-dependent DNA helicase RecG [Chromatiales bacterium]|nr:ATP-dependent DNA helicase RecG [Chromatiales bacterium]